MARAFLKPLDLGLKQVKPLEPASVLHIVAPTNEGKTFFLSEVARRACEAGRVVAFIDGAGEWLHSVWLIEMVQQYADKLLMLSMQGTQSRPAFEQMLDQVFDTADLIIMDGIQGIRFSQDYGDHAIAPTAKLLVSLGKRVQKTGTPLVYSTAINRAFDSFKPPQDLGKLDSWGWSGMKVTAVPFDVDPNTPGLPRVLIPGEQRVRLVKEFRRRVPLLPAAQVGGAQ